MSESDTDDRAEKSADAFRTISEVADSLEVPQHVLRFWETKFSQVRPMKRAGGRRYYRPDDIQLLRRIRDLLYAEGYTIRGVQKMLREKGVKSILAEEPNGTESPPQTAPQSGESDSKVVDPTPGPRSDVAAPMKPPKVVYGLTASQRKALTEVRDELKSLRKTLVG